MIAMLRAGIYVPGPSAEQTQPGRYHHVRGGTARAAAQPTGSSLPDRSTQGTEPKRVTAAHGPRPARV